MQNLKETIQKYRKEIIFGIIIFLVATTSFAFGYLTNRELNRAPIIIEKVDRE
jgi:hypothetical protein